MWRWCAIAVGLAVSGGVLQAGVIYSNFDNPPGTSFSLIGLYQVSGTASPAGLAELAFPFVSNGNYSVTQIDMVLALVGNSNYSNAFQVGIYSSLSGLPDTLLGSLYAADASVPVDDPAAVTISSISGVSLQSGQEYWLAAEPAASNTFVGLYVNSSFGDIAYSTDGSTWTGISDRSQAYFDVVGNASSSTPEPGTLILLGLGLGAFALHRRNCVFR